MDGLSSRTRTAVIAVVTTVWVVNFGAGFIVEDYKPSDAVHAAFMLIVGAMFALSGRKNGNGNGGNGSDPP